MWPLPDAAAPPSVPAFGEVAGGAAALDGGHVVVPCVAGSSLCCTSRFEPGLCDRRGVVSSQVL
eukprot:5618625-Lingulodinium_polyedra.AAC.1